MPDYLHWTPAKLQPTALTERTIQRTVIPTDTAQRDFFVRFTGQRTWIRATRLQAEQAVASDLGEVRADLVVSQTAVKA